MRRHNSGRLTLSADVFRIPILVAILAFNGGGAGGTNSQHIGLVRKIGGFPRVAYEQLDIVCLPKGSLLTLINTKRNSGKPMRHCAIATYSRTFEQIILARQQTSARANPLPGQWASHTARFMSCVGGRTASLQIGQTHTDFPPV
jgi:hypothetical protein